MPLLHKVPVGAFSLETDAASFNLIQKGLLHLHISHIPHASSDPVSYYDTNPLFIRSYPKLRPRMNEIIIGPNNLNTDF